jgi:hypothetical protein
MDLQGKQLGDDLSMPVAENYNLESDNTYSVTKWAKYPDKSDSEGVGRNFYQIIHFLGKESSLEN